MTDNTAKNNVIHSNVIEFPAESQGRVPPQNFIAEQSVLGAVLLSNDCLQKITECNLLPEHFYKRAHQIIFSAMLAMDNAQEPIDETTLLAYLTKTGELKNIGGLDYISSLINGATTNSAGSAGFHAKIIKDCALRRNLITTASDISENAWSHQGDTMDLIDSIESKILTISSVRPLNNVSKVGDLMPDAFSRLEKRRANKGALTGIGTGLEKLDKTTSGLQPSNLIIVAGRPGHGKTAFAITLLKYMAVNLSKRALFFTLEMTSGEVVDRLLSITARVSGHRIKTGDLQDADYQNFCEALSSIADHTDIIIDQTESITIGELRAKARRFHKEKPLDIIFVDYLQLMRGNPSRDSRNREQEVAEISRSLKGLAKELNVPIVALAQLNRGLEQRTRMSRETGDVDAPMLSDLRESGSIEQDADLVIFITNKYLLTRKDEHKNQANLHIAKNRHGETKYMKLLFHGEYSSFENDASEEEISIYNNTIGSSYDENNVNIVINDTIEESFL